jgi:CubicO group peptidase (beta-lactamase class C family)
MVMGANIRMQETLTRYYGLTHVDPKEEGFDPAHFDRLDGHYTKLIENGMIQAAGYVVARNGRIIANRTMGKLTHKDESPDLQPDSLRKVYSVTKVFTAVAILQLIDDGKVFLNQPISDFIPEFNNDIHRRITLFHLLTHTSGLRGDPGINFEPYTIPWYEWWNSERGKKGRREGENWIHPILAGPRSREPGEEWIYNTAGYAVLGEVITRVSGLYYEDYILERITRPLGMDRTFFDVPQVLREKTCYTNEWEEKFLFQPQERNQTDDPPRAGNGLFSTLTDLWKFGEMMLNGGTFEGHRVLSRRAVELLTDNHLIGVRNQCWGGASKDYKFGLGWSLDDYDLGSPGTFSHEGHGHCGLYVDPVERLIFVFLVPSKRGYLEESVIMPRAIVWSGVQ